MKLRTVILRKKLILSFYQNKEVELVINSFIFFFF